MLVQDFGKATMVVDITYMCNATCRYCRWGDAGTAGRNMLDPESVMATKDTLAKLGTRRVVISGGEPTLHPSLCKIIEHYSRLVDEVVIITNGYGLVHEKASEMLRAGATEFTISLDSISPVESLLVRNTEPAMHAKVLERITTLCGRRDVNISINSTVSHVTAYWGAVYGLLEFGLREGVSFVKFQPVFDDGYVSRVSPHLLLSERDVPGLREIASKIDSVKGPHTNTPDFWMDTADLAGGQDLPATGCGLGPKDAISVGGRLGICFWIDHSEYGRTSEYMSAGSLADVQSRFKTIKPKCNVGFHCFCTQRLNHAWRER